MWRSTTVLYSFKRLRIGISVYEIDLHDLDFTVRLYMHIHTIDFIFMTIHSHLPQIIFQDIIFCVWAWEAEGEFGVKVFEGGANVWHCMHLINPLEGEYNGAINVHKWGFSHVATVWLYVAGFVPTARERNEWNKSRTLFCCFSIIWMHILYYILYFAAYWFREPTILQYYKIIICIEGPVQSKEKAQHWLDKWWRRRTILGISAPIFSHNQGDVSWKEEWCVDRCNPGECLLQKFGMWKWINTSKSIVICPQMSCTHWSTWKLVSFDLDKYTYTSPLCCTVSVLTG